MRPGTTSHGFRRASRGVQPMTGARATMVVLTTALLLGSAAAQLFDPPRPPGSVPRQQPQQQLQPSQQVPPDGQLFAPSTSLGGRIQSEELPPPGSPRAGAPAGQPVAPGPANQRQQRAGLPPANAPTAAPVAPPPPEDVVTLPPTQKIVNPTAMFSGLDKITGRITASMRRSAKRSSSGRSRSPPAPATRVRRPKPR